MMTKLRKADRAKRTVRAKVSPARRASTVKAATSRVRAKAQANFRRTVRK